MEAGVDECWKVTGNPPIGVRWVGTDKGDGDIRSRLVARDFKRKEKQQAVMRMTSLQLHHRLRQ